MSDIFFKEIIFRKLFLDGWYITGATDIILRMGAKQTEPPFKVESDRLQTYMPDLGFEPITSFTLASALDKRLDIRYIPLDIRFRPLLKIKWSKFQFISRKFLKTLLKDMLYDHEYCHQVFKSLKFVESDMTIFLKKTCMKFTL